MASSKFRAIVDRIEGDMAVLEMEFGHQVIMPAIYLPREIHDGAVLAISAVYDPETTRKRREEAEKIQKRAHDKK